MADILDVGRRAELRDLAATVNTVGDARRIIEAEKLKADPGDNKSVFYYGVGHDGAKELSSKDGYVKLEQTERGYFLDQVTGKLTTEGKIPRGSDENKALFGDRANHQLGEWDRTSKEFAELSKGQALAFPDPGRTAPEFQKTTFYNAELPALASNKDVVSVTAMAYQADGPTTPYDLSVTPGHQFKSITPVFVSDKSYGVDETQRALLQAGEKAAPAVVDQIARGYNVSHINAGGPMAAVSTQSLSRSQDVPASPAADDRVTATLQSPQASPAKTPGEQRAERFAALSPADRAADPELRNAQAHLSIFTHQVQSRISDPQQAAKITERAEAEVVSRLSAGETFKAPQVQDVTRVREAPPQTPAQAPRELTRAAPERER